MSINKDLEDLLADRYAQLKKTISHITNSSCHIDGNFINDEDIYDELQICLDIIQIDGIIIHFGQNDLWLSCLKFEHQRNEKTIIEHLNKNEFLQQSECAFFKTNDFSYMQSVIRSTDSHKCQEKRSSDVSCKHYSDNLFLLNPNQELFGELEPSNCLSSSRWYAIFTAFHEVFIHRNNVYQHFPIILSQHYWEKHSFLFVGKDNFNPPWGHEMSTITLSLDLRKSTIAMEQATNLEKYSNWMRDLIKELTEIAINHQAVFDKFTGDGVMVHFLKEDVERLLVNSEYQQKSAIELAVVCAAKMVQAVNNKLAELRKFLQSDFSNLGAAVGLAEGKAQWSTDHTGNPIVVGRGVVGACRAADKAPADFIFMANTAYQLYKCTELFKHALPMRMQLDSKDFHPEIKVHLWQLKVENVLKHSHA